MINDSIKAKGTLVLTLTDELGNVKSNDAYNLVVTAGLNYIASRMKDATATVMTHMALGSGATAAALGDTDLQTLLDVRRALVSTTVSTNTITYVGTFTAGQATGAVTEAGIFNAASAGTMLSRTVFSVINKGALDTLTVTWTITLS